jgi:hypothetical protein
MGRVSLRFFSGGFPQNLQQFIFSRDGWEGFSGAGSVCTVGGIESSEFSSIHVDCQAVFARRSIFGIAGILGGGASARGGAAELYSYQYVLAATGVCGRNYECEPGGYGEQRF